MDSGTISPSGLDSARADRSVAPPVPYGMTIWIVRSGYSASAGPVTSAVAQSAAAIILRFIGFSSLGLFPERAPAGPARVSRALQLHAARRAVPLLAASYMTSSLRSSVSP